LIQESLTKQFKQSKFVVAMKILRNKSNVAKTLYRLSKIQTFFKRVERLYRLRLSAAHVNQSLKNWTTVRSISYVRKSFIEGQLRKSVS